MQNELVAPDADMTFLARTLESCLKDGLRIDLMPCDANGSRNQLLSRGAARRIVQYVPNNVGAWCHQSFEAEWLEQRDASVVPFSWCLKRPGRRLDWHPLVACDTATSNLMHETLSGFLGPIRTTACLRPFITRGNEALHNLNIRIVEDKTGMFVVV